MMRKTGLVISSRIHNFSFAGELIFFFLSSSTPNTFEQAVEIINHFPYRFDSLYVLDPPFAHEPM